MTTVELRRRRAVRMSEERIGETSGGEMIGESVREEEHAAEQ